MIKTADLSNEVNKLLNPSLRQREKFFQVHLQTQEGLQGFSVSEKKLDLLNRDPDFPCGYGEFVGVPKSEFKEKVSAIFLNGSSLLWERSFVKIPVEKPIAEQAKELLNEAQTIIEKNVDSNPKPVLPSKSDGLVKKQGHNLSASAPKPAAKPAPAKKK